MRALPLLCGLLLVGCPKKNDKRSPVDPASKDDAGKVASADDASLTLAPAPPLPAVPAGLPPLPDRPLAPIKLSPEAVALGELLFFDPRLSATAKLSCASCHDPAAGFAGARPQDTATGKPNLRRAPTLVNLAWHTEYGWDGRYPSLAEHLQAHVRGQLGDELATITARLAEVPGYRAHYARLGGAEASTTLDALASYSLTRYAGAAPWDRLERSPDVPADVKAGYVLFSGKAQCAVCHSPPLYTDHGYHRLGLVATPDEGRGRIDPAHKGAFKTPTVRGAGLRTGFFHDGSAPTLDAAIDWHLAGGLGQGADPSIIDPALDVIRLTPQERTQLGAFVRALTDPAAPPPAIPALP